MRFRRRTTEISLAAFRAVTNPQFWRRMLLVILSGVLVFTSYPKYDFFFLQWFSLDPLLFVLANQRPGPAFSWGFLCGLVTNWGGFWWVTSMLMDFGHFSLALAIPLCTLLCAYQGLVFALWAALTRWLVLRTGASLLLVAPVVWVVVEYLLPFIFPWYFGNGQYLFYPAIQIAEITGVMGVSFILVLVNVGIYQALAAGLAGNWRLALRPALFAATVFSLNVLYGVVRMVQVDEQMAQAPKLKIGVGEANVGIFEKEAKHLQSASLRLGMLRGNILKHHLLAEELEEVHGVDLVVEPESSFSPVPWPWQSVRFKRSDIFAVAAGVGRDLWELDDDRWKSQRFGPEKAVINDVVAAREDRMFAVGDNGRVLAHDGGEWRAEPLSEEQDLYGVWAGELSPKLGRIDGVPIIAMAVGDRGAAWFRDVDGTWHKSNTGTQETLLAVHGNGAKMVIAVGETGTVMRWSLKEWTREKVDTKLTLRGVHVTSDGKVTVVGNQGVILSRTGARWAKQHVGEAALNGLAANRRDMVVVGDGGTVLRQKGQNFVPMKSGTARNLKDVAVGGRGNFYAVGDGGLVLTLPRGADTWLATGPLRGGGTLNAVTGVPFTQAHTFARDSRWLYRSRQPLPKVQAANRIAAVEDIGPTMALDRGTPPEDWNTPLRGFKTPILLGLLTYEPSDPDVSPIRDREARKMYNSAMLLDGDGKVLGRYDKNYLLIFGEYIPFGDLFPQFYEWLPEASHFYAGDTVETFAFKGHQLGVMICYEDIIPRFTRKLAGKDPNVLINVTNDAWFGKTSEPYLHLALATVRSVENRLWLVRSTNTGVSAFVDAVGRIVKGTSLDDAEVLVADVPMLRTSTIYRSYGDLFSYGCLVAFFMLAIGALARPREAKKKKKKRTTELT